jgi:hypothetical protein
MRKPTDILLENLELIIIKVNQIKLRQPLNIESSRNLNQIRQLSLSSIEIIKNNNKPIPPALEEKLREDIKKLKQSIDFLLTHQNKPKMKKVDNIQDVITGLNYIKAILEVKSIRTKNIKSKIILFKLKNEIFRELNPVIEYLVDSIHQPNPKQTNNENNTKVNTDIINNFFNSDHNI